MQRLWTAFPDGRFDIERVAREGGTVICSQLPSARPTVSNPIGAAATAPVGCTLLAFRPRHENATTQRSRYGTGS